MEKMLKVSSNPHIRSKDTTARIMQYVVIALLPATLFGIFNFGLHALLLVLVTVATTVLTEYIYDRCMKKKNSISDFSAVVTGLLLALNLPPRAPWWIGVIGGVFAIIVVKMLFGGLGQNFMNPALGARCFLIISFTSIMTNFDCDAYTGATPLAAIKAGEGAPKLLDMIIGRTAGTIGETSMIALLIGAVFLLVMKVIDLRVPGSYILSFVVFILLFSGHGLDINYILSQLAGGGLMLGAFFMATDYVTSPVSHLGQAVFGVGCGLITVFIRYFGSYNEGVCYAILLMNLTVWLIDKNIKPRRFGVVKAKSGASPAKKKEAEKK